MGLGCSIWIDVEDVFQYFEVNARPSGIQRLVREILRVIRVRADARDAPMQIRLIRRPAGGRGGDAPFAPVSFADVERLFETSANPGLDNPRGGRVATTRSGLPTRRPRTLQRLRHALIQRVEAVPTEIRSPLLTIAVHQLRAVRLARRYAMGRLRRGRPASGASGPLAEVQAIGAQAPAMQDVPRPGDVLLILGAAWSEHGFGKRLARMREAYGIRPVLLVYDLIPAIHPEWCARSLVLDFRHWLDSTLPQCGRLLAISQATARSVETYALNNGLHLVAPVRPIPIGSGFGWRPSCGARPPGLPAPGSYVLFVSTLEARKNHILAFLVWQRLLAGSPPREVPVLVFAGRQGWLIADLMQQIENTDWLRGKIRLLRDPTDEELAHLYDGCLFTLFPSLFEGWGLPVSESLINGAPCIASNSTSIPEAGGLLTRYFDPESVDDAHRVVQETLADPEGIARWRQEVRERFRPTPWEATADAVLDACDAAHRDRRG